MSMRPQYALRAARILRRYYSTPKPPAEPAKINALWQADTFDERVANLEAHPNNNGRSSQALEELYPRFVTEPTKIGSSQFQKIWRQKDAANTWDDTTSAQGHGEHYSLSGKVTSVRRHGKNFIFLNIAQRSDEDQSVQIMCSFKGMQATDEEAVWRFFSNTVKPGDAYTFHGVPVKTSGNSVTLKATRLPQLLAPSLHDRPEKLLDQETLARFPQLRLESAVKQRRLQIRADIEFGIHQFLRSHEFVHVNTPILAADAGGAVAKPFVVNPSAASENELYLRIAPELELKKLIAAGMDRVYELGPSFRNEGLDATHNPEFTTCEFYQAYANLEDVMKTTEELFRNVTEQVAEEKASLVAEPFGQIQFIPGLESEIRNRGIEGFTLPCPLTQESWKDMLSVFEQLAIPLPTDSKHLRTTHLLDMLSSHLLEPLCVTPTFITDYPALMSPLAKSYTCRKTGHELAARAELFINSTEYANMYEEENSPFAQARKFLIQKLENAAPPREVAGVEAKVTDANSTAVGSLSRTSQLSHHEIVQQLSPAQRYYIRVLEMGLPPTAGWGCGIERLVMLLADAPRIGDVLPFGNLRHVIAMGT